jgi:hypothetical protein
MAPWKWNKGVQFRVWRLPLRTDIRWNQGSLIRFAEETHILAYIALRLLNLIQYQLN